MASRDDPPPRTGSDEERSRLLDGEIVPAGQGELIPVAAIEARRESCLSCFRTLEPARAETLRVVDIVRDEEGWAAQGRYTHGTQCPDCGQVYQAVTQRIEVDCAQYTCGRCGPATSLRTEVLRLTEDGGDYLFTVVLTCPRCSRRRRVTRALTAPFRVIKRLRVGADGVEVETHSDGSP